MWLKRVILLFFTGAVMVMSEDRRINLTKTPKSENVTHGSTLILHCCLNTSGCERCIVKWLFQPSGLNGETTVVQNHNYKNFSSDSDCFSSTYSVTVTELNAGWYFCNVTKEIPTLTHIESNKTEIVVEKGYTTIPSLTTQSPVIPEDEHNAMSLWIMIGASSFVFLILILLVICAVCRRCRRSREEPIYINTRSAAKKQPSPRPGLQVASLKNVPSSEDLRAPSPSRRYEQGTRKYKY